MIKIETIKRVVRRHVTVSECWQRKSLFNKLQHRGEFVLCMRYLVGPRVRGNDEQRYTRTESESINARRGNMVVEASVIIPGEEYHRGIPLRPLHHGINFPHGPIFTGANLPCRMLAESSGNQPTDLR